MTTLARRIWHLLNRRRFERDLVREMREHREQMFDPSSFGDLHRHLERSRDAWGWNWLDDALHDVALGARSLIASPSFAIVATLILSFGIGLNVTLYTIVSVALLQPLPVASPGTLARFHRSEPHSSSTGVAYPVTQWVREHNTVLSAVLTETRGTVSWGPDGAEDVEAAFVSTNWFTELGYGAMRGRVFSDAVDGDVSLDPGAVISERVWRTRLGSNPGIVGSTVYIDTRPVTVVGVASERMPGLDFDTPGVYLPLPKREYFYPRSTLLKDWDDGTIDMYGRLRPGISRAAVREGLRASMRSLAAERPAMGKDVWLEPLMGDASFMRDEERLNVLIGVSLMGGLTGLVLLVAATNLANLVLSRATSRVRELGIRVAIGAGRARIVRQLIAESIPLGLLGAGGGLLFSAAAVRAIAASSDMPPYFDISLDWRSIAASLGLAIVALVVVGVLPAWKVAQQDLTDAIKDGGQHVSRLLDRAFLRRLMTMAQVAGTCLLLAVAGMMVRGVQRVLWTDLGFEYQNAAVLSMPLGRFGITGPAAQNYWHAVENRVAASAEVDGATIVTAAPLGGRLFETRYNDTPGLSTVSQNIEGNYFDVMRVPIVAGRTFAPPDAHVVIVSRRLALEMYGTIDVLGKRFPKSDPEGQPIVGIAEDAHSIKVNATHVAELYRPLVADDYATVFLVARARTDPARVLPVMRDAARMDARVMPSVSLMRDDFAHRVSGPRAAGAIASAVGVVTLVLACLGIFGVVSYGIAIRMKEIGIRIALGASQVALVRAVMWQVTVPIAVGMAAGLIAAFPTGRLMAGEPFYLESVDPTVFASAMAIFLIAGLSAAAMPALAVLRANPVEFLRRS